VKNRYVIVGFKVSEENAIYYRKCRTIEELQKSVYIAFEKRDADFVSIRKIKETVEKKPDYESSLL